MTGDIFLLQDDGQLVELNEAAYETEALLQRLLAQHPDLLAGLQLLDKFNAIEGIDFPAEVITRRPSVSLAIFEDETRGQQLLAVFDWIIQQIKQT